MDNIDFREMFVRLRRLKGMTQEDLAKELHISRSAVANFESGTRTPSFYLLMTICDKFDISVSELLGEPSPADLMKHDEGFREIVRKLSLLDAADRARIDERIDIMLESEKYHEYKKANLG